MELERGSALFQKGRARYGFRRAVARQGRPHPGPPYLPGSLERARQGDRQSLQGGWVRISSGPERRVQGRLFPGHDLQPLRPPGLGGDRLSRSGNAAARQSDDLDVDLRQGAAVRGHTLRRRQGAGRRQGNRTPCRRSHRLFGAIYSPAHLLRAGIGPAGHLRDLGIEIVAHVPGVGQRLMDHPSISISSFIKPECRLNSLTRRHILVALRYSSGIGDAPAGDMLIAGISKSAWHAVGEQIGSLFARAYKTFSETGQVKLASRDWRAEPIVELNLLSDPRDLERLMDAFRRLCAMQLSLALRQATSDPFPTNYTERVRASGVVNTKNKLITEVIANLLDGPAWLRRLSIQRVLGRGYVLGELMRDREALEDYIRKTATGVRHASCTCRMGSEDDPMAVTDTQGRVHGVGGLRVVDASLFPVVPRADTNFPTLMTAEKIADAMLATA